MNRCYADAKAPFNKIMAKVLAESSDLRSQMSACLKSSNSDSCLGPIVADGTRKFDEAIAQMSKIQV